MCIQRTAEEDTHFKFGTWLKIRKPIQKVAKLGQLRTGPGSRDLLLNFGTPSISNERLKIQTSNLVCGLKTRRPIQKVAKLCQLGTEPESRDLLFNYATSSISTERLKIDTSYLVRRLTTTYPIHKFAKLGQMGTCPGLRDLLLGLHFDFLYRCNGCSY